MKFLRFKGAGQYEELLSVEDGWGAWPKRRTEEDDTTQYLEVVIEETVDAGRNAAIGLVLRDFLTDVDDKATDIGIGGVAYKIIKDHVEPPVVEPREWIMRVYLTEGQLISAPEEGEG